MGVTFMNFTKPLIILVKLERDYLNFFIKNKDNSVCILSIRLYNENVRR